MNSKGEQTDSELIAAYLKGDEESLSILLNRHINSALIFCRGLVGESEAEDIVQETCVKVWRNLKKFDRQKKFKTWFLTIAKNTCLDFLRKKRPTVFSDFENDDGENAFLEELSDDAPLAPEITDASLSAEKIRTALGTLTTKNRIVMEMHYYDEMTLQEIADIMGESVNTVKSRYRRALSALKTELEHENLP
jgi:RNA polymerase sigma-70 factor, ECF subfamily